MLVTTLINGSQNLQGYYKSSSVLGPDGDFVTSPEIVQMFGEVIRLAICLRLDSWSLDCQ